MNILYQGIAGSAPVLWLAILLWSFAVLLAIMMIYFIIDDHDTGWLSVCLLIFFVVGMGFMVNRDTRYTEIKAVIDDTTSWKEINEKYELISQQGDIYTFKLREDNINK